MKKNILFLVLALLALAGSILLSACGGNSLGSILKNNGFEKIDDATYRYSDYGMLAVIRGEGLQIGENLGYDYNEQTSIRNAVIGRAFGDDVLMWVRLHAVDVFDTDQIGFVGDYAITISIAENMFFTDIMPLK